MITRTTRIQLLAFLTLAALATSYLGYRYVGLDRLVLGSGYEVAAEFEDSGGIFVNAEVTYRADNDIAVSGDTAAQVKKLLAMLEDLDDVQNVYSNANIPAEVMAVLEDDE